MNHGIIVDLFAGGGLVAELCPDIQLRRPGAERVICCSWCLRAVRTRSVRTKWCDWRCQNRACALRPRISRACAVCSTPFDVSLRGRGNAKHCSESCSAISARASRAAFARRRPEQSEVYRQTHRAKGKKDTSLNRLLRKYPWLPRHCEACGESRVLDIAHRPGHERNGAWISMRVNTPDRIWILCPTCHALLDRAGYTPEQLGIRERDDDGLAAAIFGANVEQRSAVAA